VLRYRRGRRSRDPWTRSPLVLDSVGVRYWDVLGCVPNQECRTDRVGCFTASCSREGGTDVRGVEPRSGGWAERLAGASLASGHQVDADAGLVGDDLYAGGAWEG
jgi:hypothetical protein